MTSSPTLSQQMDPRRPVFVSIFGRKASGKSKMAEAFWHSWPFDRFVIDPTGDFDAGEDTETLHDPLPWRWPAPAEEGARVSLRYRPDPGSPTYAEDLDRAIGVVWNADHDRPKLLLLDELGEVTSAHNTGPSCRRLLYMNRHRNISVVSCCARSKDINPLFISQADFIYVFELPAPMDQQRLAETMGVDPGQLRAALAELPRYGYLRYDPHPDPELARHLGVDLRDLRLVEFPPMPLDAVKGHRRARQVGAVPVEAAQGSAPPSGG